MGTITAYNKNGDQLFVRSAYVDSKLRGNNPDGMTLMLSGCEGIGVIQSTLHNGGKVKVVHGPYHTYVRSVTKYDGGYMGYMECDSYPFYIDGPTFYDGSGSLSTSPIVVPATGGNHDGLIKSITLNTSLIPKTVDLYYEHTANTTTAILDSADSVTGTTSSNGSAYGGSFKQMTVSLSTSNSTQIVGLFPFDTHRMFDMVSGSPRNIALGFLTPYWGSADKYLFQMSSGSQYTQWVPYGNPITTTHRFMSPSSLVLHIRGGDISSYPVSGDLMRLDWIGMYPTYGVKMINPPSNVGSGEIVYALDHMDFRVYSQGRKIHTSGVIPTSSSVPTIIYDVGKQVSSLDLTPLRGGRTVSVETLTAYRLPASRLE